jgi:hypothetical protein
MVTRNSEIGQNPFPEHMSDINFLSYPMNGVKQRPLPLTISVKKMLIPTEDEIQYPGQAIIKIALFPFFS